MGIYNNIMPQMDGQLPTDMNNPSMPRPQTPISPKAFSNQANIGGMFGQAVQGTFNRQVGSTPFMQTATEGRMTSQGYIPGIDPTDGSTQPTINAVTTAQTGRPLAPPVGVQQPISPYYDLSTQ